MSVEKRAKRKIQRKHEAEKFQKDRLICDYIRIRHPDIYREAENVYDHLRQAYPEKKDLRKSNEYEAISKQGLNMPIKKYYARKTKQYVPKRQSDPKDNMLLTIPLMSTNDVEEVVLEQLSQNETTIVMEQSTQPSQNETTIVMEQSTQPSQSIEPPLTEAMMADLINELRGDPDILSFFENIEFELDDCPLW